MSWSIVIREEFEISWAFLESTACNNRPILRPRLEVSAPQPIDRSPEMLEFCSMDTYMGYVTFKNQNEAQSLCQSMVEKRLVACANIHAPHTAIYEWENSVHVESEVSATLKTTKDRLKAVEDFIVQNHSYTTPCLVFWPIEEGTDNFLDWIYKQTHD